MRTIKSTIKRGRNSPLDLSKINSGNISRQQIRHQERVQVKAQKSTFKQKQNALQRQAKFKKYYQEKGQPVAGTAAQLYLEKRGLWPCDNSDIIFLDKYPYWQELKQPDDSMKWLETLHPAIVFLARKAPQGSVESGLVLSLDDQGNKANITKFKSSTGQHVNDTRRFAPLIGGHGYWIGNKDSDTLIICEGVENAHSLQIMRDNTPLICAAFSCNFMKNITPPKGIKTVIMAGDNDADKKVNAGQEGNRKAGDKLAALGYIVKTIVPPEGMDWNDLLLSQGKGRAA